MISPPPTMLTYSLALDHGDFSVRLPVLADEFDINCAEQVFALIIAAARRRQLPVAAKELAA